MDRMHARCCHVFHICARSLGDVGNQMGILDKQFRYVPASKTDISKTFARERKRIAEERERLAASEAEQQVKVRKIKGENA